jgi:hypothetical protein
MRKIIGWKRIHHLNLNKIDPETLYKRLLNSI